MTRLRRPLLLASVLVSSACGGAGGSDAGDGFVSDNPGGGSGGGDGDYDGEGDEGAGDAGDDGGQPPGGDDGEDAIEEADLIRIVGNRLYALSQISGLTIVDVSERDRLPVLGHYRAHGRPFEMYVDGDQVFIMYSDFGEYSYVEDEGYAWRQNSRLLALDTSDPAAIEARGEFDMPGSIQDSRRVGDFLYLVTYENGYCWGCKNTPNTTITSLDVSNPAEVSIADQLTFEASGGGYWYGGTRSVSSTTERMYVAGPEYGTDGNHSVVQVVDISDESGALVEGASLTVHGQIESRWQMDEYEGVLRVISQPWWGNEDETPVLETFQIVSSQELTPLASLAVVLPRPEVLQSARFDGDRAYAITFEQTDPLFTFDLSDPANPLQTGELEIPGWVHHMEPRGDRLLGLGYDREHPDGSINVSVFDVSDLSQPQLLDRVHFGGDWANFNDDQNRLHKAFTILEDEGLLLVPFSGWSWDDTSDYCSTYRSGIQLVDYSGDDLVLRGFAEAHGTAKRSFLHDERLFAISDKAIQTFDIADRDVPVQKLGLPIAANVNRSVRSGDLVVRLAADWWTSEIRLEVVNADHAEDAMALGVLPLAEILGEDSSYGYEDGCYGNGLYDAELVANGEYVYLIYSAWGDAKGATKIMVIDVSEPTEPTYVDTVSMDFMSRSWWASFGGFDLASQRVVLRGSTMVFVNSDVEYDEETPLSKSQFVLVDVSNPEEPEQLIELDRPAALQHGGLVAFDDTVVSWHARPVGTNDERVRFYLERIDLGGDHAIHRKPVNVPGLPVAYDPTSDRAITVDFEVEVLENVDEWEECFKQVKAYDLREDGCHLVRQYANIVQLHESSADRLARQEIEPKRRVYSVMGSTERAFIVSSDRSEYYWGWGAEDSPGSDDEYQPPIFGVGVVGGMDDGEVETGDIVNLGSNYWGWGANSRTVGTQLLLSSSGGLAIIDGEDTDSPSMRVESLYGYSCQHIEVSGDTAYCSMGESGLQAIPLD